MFLLRTKCLNQYKLIQIKKKSFKKKIKISAVKKKIFVAKKKLKLT